MINTMTIQEVLGIFERFDQEIQLQEIESKKPDSGWLLKTVLFEDYSWLRREVPGSQLVFSCFLEGTSITGRIRYSNETPIRCVRDSISILLGVEGILVFSESYEIYPENPNGEFPDMCLVLDFIRKMDKRLKEKKYQKLLKERELDQREASKAVEKLHRLMR